MTIHTQLPIYKVAYDLLDAISDLTAQFPRNFRASMGEQIRVECVHIVTLVARANIAREKAPHLEALLESLPLKGSLAASRLADTYGCWHRLFSATRLTSTSDRAYASPAAQHGAAGIGVPSGAAKSRDAVMQCGFSVCARPHWAGRAGSRKARRCSTGTPTRSVPPTPIGVGRRFVQRTGAHAMSAIPHATQLPFAAIFTPDEVERVEAAYNRTWGPKRRTLQAFLMRSSDELLINIKAEGDAEVLLILTQVLIDYRQHLAAGTALIDCALNRLQVLAEHVDLGGFQ